jgi:hypothetical protein
LAVPGRVGPGHTRHPRCFRDSGLYRTRYARDSGAGDGHDLALELVLGFGSWVKSSMVAIGSRTSWGPVWPASGRTSTISQLDVFAQRSCATCFELWALRKSVVSAAFNRKHSLVDALPLPPVPAPLPSLPNTDPGTSGTLVFYVTQSCFRAVNRPSGPDFGRTATGNAPKSALWPAAGPTSVLSR